MTLQDFLDRFEKAGLTTFGQVKSALVAANVDPMAISVNHAELDKTVRALVPVASAAAGTAAGAAVGSLVPEGGPTASVFAQQVAGELLTRLTPQLEHQMERLADSLHTTLEAHMSPVHELLQTAASVQPPAAPATPPVPITTTP